MTKTNHKDKLPEGTEIVNLVALSPVEKQVVLMHKEKLAAINKEFQDLLESIKKAMLPVFQARFNAVAADLSAYSTSLMEGRGISPDEYILNADKLIFDLKAKQEEAKTPEPVKEAAPTG